MRRRRREQTITLFAFQDIITGVAGVMLFILLLLVVQLTVKTVQAAQEQGQQESDPATDPKAAEFREFAETKQNLSALKQQLADLAAENEALLQASSADLDSAIEAAQQELTELIQQADQIKAEARQIEAQVAEQGVSQQRQAIIDRRSELEAKLQALEQEQRRHASGKLVTFNSTTRSRKDMWVVDYRDRRASLFDVKDPTSTEQIQYDRETPPPAVVERIKQRLQQQTKNRSIILVLRPSAAGQGLEILAAFRSAKFDIALELLDEDTMIAAPASGGDIP